MEISIIPHSRSCSYEIIVWLRLLCTVALPQYLQVLRLSIAVLLEIFAYTVPKLPFLTSEYHNPSKTIWKIHYRYLS